jgi:hypothetical protein
MRECDRIGHGKSMLDKVPHLAQLLECVPVAALLRIC